MGKASEKIRIMYLVRRAVGGILTHVIDLARSLPSDRYEAMVVAPPSGRFSKQLPELGIPFVELDISDDLNPIADLSAAWKCRGILRQFRPQILHIHGNKAALVGRMAAWGMGIPVQIVTVHNLLRYMSRPGLKRALATAVERYLSRGTDLIISVSNDLAKDLTSGQKLAPAKVKVVYNGIDWRRLQVSPEMRMSTREDLGFEREAIVVGMIARLAAQKRPDVFIAACSKLKDVPRVKFLLVGEGPLAAKVKKDVRQLELEESFTLTGFRNDVPEVLSAIDIFVLSSKWEGVPYVLEEAMAAARPVVSTAVGGVPELITDGKSGLLVPPGDSEALANAISRLLNDADLKADIAKNAQQTIQEEFSVEKMVEETVAIYEEVLAEKKSQARVV